MRRFTLLFLVAALAGSLSAQSRIYGKVSDRLTGDVLEGVTVSARAVSAQSAKDGSYMLLLPPGEYQVVAQRDGFDSDTFAVSLEEGKQVELNIALDDQSASMQSVQITASIAKDRKTPVAYANLTGKAIGERLGSADLPVLLNTTPGVYATQQGGGAGDARITIRGFNQRNIAVMIDGIPVNDMENGEVYWSNWYGLSEVTAVTQVQRGLGSSRIANPAVGGTMNIITRGVSDKFQANASLEMGDSRYRKFATTVNSGKLPGDFGVVLSITSRSSTGYVDGLYDDMFSYFFKVEKRWGNKATLSFTGLGAPQSHGQRSFRARLSLYDTAFARELGMDTSVGGMPVNRGRKYNQHLGYLRYASVENGDTAWGARTRVNERENMFHKPQYSVKFDYKPSKKAIWSTTAYASVGKGGGTASRRVAQTPSTYGQYDFQGVYFQNTVGSVFVSPIDPAYSTTLRKAAGILYRSVNNHKWYGLLSTYNVKLNARSTFTGGIDARTYVGQHWREIYDLLGGEYYVAREDGANPKHVGELYFKGDKYAYHNDGRVRWGGVFAEYEYSYRKLTVFANISASNSWYQRVDYFRPDTNGGKTAWVTRQGLTAKTGINYNLSSRWNVFANLGYLDRPARFNNVFDNRNRQVKKIQDEIVTAAEAGAGYKSKWLSVDVNAYYTVWNNRPLNFLPTYRDPDGNVFSYNINGLSARHMGAEILAALKPLRGLTIEGAFSFGDWIWTSGTRSIVLDDAGDSVAIVDFDATGVHVGDAAQQQIAGVIRWEPSFIKGLYISFQYVRFSKHFADFEPTALVETPTESFKRRESYQLPAYGYLNGSWGYQIPGIKKYRVSLYGNVSNITNNLYISDAQHRNVNNEPQTTFNPRNLEVFVSPGARFTVGMRVGF